MKLIDKSVLVAEIERIKEMYCYDTKTNASFVAEAVINSINNAIDAIEVKEVDLDKEIDDWYQNKASKEFEKVFYDDIEKCAKYFFELGLFSQLTWQDIRLISEIGEDFMNSEESDDLWKDEEVYYTAILNKLKEKGRNYKIER